MELLRKIGLADSLRELGELVTAYWSECPKRYELF